MTPPEAATRTSVSGGTLALITCFCAIVLVFGVAHYRGWHRQWLRVVPFEANFFMPAWFGACGLLTVLGLLAGHITIWLEVVLAVPILVTFVIMCMSFVWLPRRLLPGWYLDWRAHGRPPWELKN